MLSCSHQKTEVEQTVNCVSSVRSPDARVSSRSTLPWAELRFFVSIFALSVTSTDDDAAAAAAVPAARDNQLLLCCAESTRLNPY